MANFNENFGKNLVKYAIISRKTKDLIWQNIFLKTKILIF